MRRSVRKCVRCEVPFVKGDEVVADHIGDERFHVRCWHIRETEQRILESKNPSRASPPPIDAAVKVLPHLRRIIVVRRNADRLYRLLRRRYRLHDRDTLVIYDRRRTASEQRAVARRFPQRLDILESRGYLVIRMRGAVPARLA